MNREIIWYSKVEGHQEKTLLQILGYFLPPCDLNTSESTQINYIVKAYCFQIGLLQVYWLPCEQQYPYTFKCNFNTNPPLFSRNPSSYIILEQHLIMPAHARERLDQDPWTVKPQMQIQNYLNNFWSPLQRRRLLPGKGDGRIQLMWTSNRFWNIQHFCSFSDRCKL